jgi:hypothetical protein
MKRVGRKRPYFADEMKRQKCRACGKQAVHQWNCCANDNRWVPVCLDCDFALNEMALAFFRVPGRVALMTRYRRRELVRKA